MLLGRCLDPLIDLVLPRCCVGCARPGTGLCVVCLAVDAPLRLSAGGMPVFAAGSYAGSLRAGLLAYKERGRRDLARPLAGLLTLAVRAALDGIALDGGAVHCSAPDGRGRGAGARCIARRGGGVALVPVPSAARVAASRGGAHVARLAVHAAHGLDMSVARGALTLTRTVRDSAGLGVAARAANLKGALRATSAPPATTALLVDDVVTTGVTLAEARRALQASGWPVLGAAVVLATPRW